MPNSTQSCGHVEGSDLFFESLVNDVKGHCQRGRVPIVYSPSVCALQRVSVVVFGFQ